MTRLDRVCLPLTAAMSVSVAVLNFYAEHSFHTIEKYLVFRERILHGFEVTNVMPSYQTPPTFPMWGYGWVLLLTTNKVLLIGLQIVVALWAAWYFLRVLDELQLLSRWSRVLLRLFLVLCLPWYTYNSIDWCQSLATSFLILSLALLLPIMLGKPVSWRRIGLSALCFGINLNFASDLYLLPIPLALASWWCAKWSRTAGAQVLFWLAGIVLALVPWMLYTWRATGTPLVKATNQGHVLLVGLGQDPHARFGVTYSDGDARMLQILRDELGEDFSRRFYASCAFEADAPLRRAFLQIIAQQPLAYLDLVLIKLRLILKGDIGTYNGEFSEGRNVGSFGIGARFRRSAQRQTGRVGRLLQLGTTVFAPIAMWMAFRRGKRAWVLVLLPILYTYSTCSVAVLQPQYLSGLILLQLSICAYGVGVVMDSMWGLLVGAQGADAILQ